jgi:Ca2+-binding RTX toxin-like protein
VNVDTQTLSGHTANEIIGDVLGRIFSGNLKMIGTAGDDFLETGRGNDQVLGGKGNDTLDGGLGKDVLTGGAGSDTFHFIVGDGYDTITDFDADGGIGHQDFISGNFSDVTSIDQVGANTVIHFGAHDTLTLLHVNTTQIDANDFSM